MASTSRRGCSQNNLRATGYVRTDDANSADRCLRRTPHRLRRAHARIDSRADTFALDDRPYAGVIAALAIGDERAIPASQWQLFNRTGVGHLISISGLHITFFATLIGAALYWLWRRSHALTTRLPARKAAAVAACRRRVRLRLARGLSDSRAANAVHARGRGDRPVAWPPGHRFRCLALGAGGRTRLGPWAGLTPGFWLSFGAVGLLLYIGVGRIGKAPAVARGHACAGGDHRSG